VPNSSLISLPFRWSSILFCQSEDPDILLRPAASASLAELSTKPHSQRLQAAKAIRKNFSGSNGVISPAKPSGFSTFPAVLACQTREDNEVRRSRKARRDIQRVFPVAVGVLTLAEKYWITFVAQQRRSLTAV